MHSLNFWSNSMKDVRALGSNAKQFVWINFHKSSAQFFGCSKVFPDLTYFFTSWFDIPRYGSDPYKESMENYFLKYVCFKNYIAKDFITSDSKTPHITFEWKNPIDKSFWWTPFDREKSRSIHKSFTLFYSHCQSKISKFQFTKRRDLVFWNKNWFLKKNKEFWFWSN